ncbi:hypothetical protein GDO78_022397 [Eleutherodactylus coqui]|uniref:Uncharacterized protein n=1 Tax=Eleutherodactylus coqui TaxID=57060 RepID=A0A8J6EPA6_ELECQ|nr:hypothetical protein GDO78_022397 [Eleutherodactylus coqui]
MGGDLSHDHSHSLLGNVLHMNRGREATTAVSSFTAVLTSCGQYYKSPKKGSGQVGEFTGKWSCPLRVSTVPRQWMRRTYYGSNHITETKVEESVHICTAGSTRSTYSTIPPVKTMDTVVESHSINGVRWR